MSPGGKAGRSSILVGNQCRANLKVGNECRAKPVLTSIPPTLPSQPVARPKSGVRLTQPPSGVWKIHAMTTHAGTNVRDNHTTSAAQVPCVHPSMPKSLQALSMQRQT
eukprot:341528-Chlamydomonas_euryale.AAC.2